MIYHSPMRERLTSAYFINLFWSNNMTENKLLHYFICNGHIWSNLSRAEAYANEYYEKTKIILGIERASVIFNQKTQRYEEA